MQAAIEKLSNEIANDTNPYVQAIGQFLIDFVTSNPKFAESFVVDGKTIIGSLEEMRKEAEKVKVGNCAVLTDQQGFSIVLKYFGIDKEPTLPVAAKPKVKPKAKSNIVPLRSGNYVQSDMFDFLEEG